MTATENAQQRGGLHYGWAIVGVVVLSGICANALPINAFSLFLRDWSAELNTPVSTFMLGIASVGLVTAVLAPIVGAAADKHSARILIGTGVALIAVLCVAVSLMREIWQYFLIYCTLVPLGLTLGATLIGNVLVSRWFVQQMGLALGIISFGTGLGGVVLPPLIAAVLDDIGWRALWQYGAAFAGFIVLPLVFFVIRDRPAGSATAAGAHGHHGAASGEKLTLGQIFSRPIFWMLVACYLPMLAVFGGVAQNLAPIATSRGLGQEDAGMLISLLSLSQLVGTLAVGMLSDRIGNRAPLAGLGFATALGGVLVAFGTGLIPLAAGVILAGLGNAFWPLKAALIAREFGGAHVGRVFGLVSMFMPVTVFTPFIVAKVYEATGSYTPSLLALALLCVITGAVCALFMREKPRAAAG